MFIVSYNVNFLKPLKNLFRYVHLNMIILALLIKSQKYIVIQMIYICMQQIRKHKKQFHWKPYKRINQNF